VPFACAALAACGARCLPPLPGMALMCRVTSITRENRRTQVGRPARSASCSGRPHRGVLFPARARSTLRSHKTRGVRRESPRKSPVELGLPRWVLDRTGSGIQG
jgi:hypothetical protein